MKKNTKLFLILKSVAITLFLFLSILIVSCGSSSNNTNPGDLGNPVVTVTIHLGEINGSPTPQFPDYACGGWATDTSPPYNPSSMVSVYAKFTHTKPDGNPEGVPGASAVATILWPDGSTDTKTTTTGNDGLAVFPVALKPVALNKTVLVEITFSKQNVPTCTIPQAAYFTATLGTVTPSATPNYSPTASPSPAGTGTPTGTPSGTPSPTPKPTKTPKPH